MDGKPGLLDQLDDRLQAILIRNSERTMDTKPELCQTDNVGDIKILKRSVVGDVEKDRLDVLEQSHTVFCRRGVTRFFRTVFRGAPPGAREVFAGVGALMIRRTADTRPELSPRISPISSGVGTGLPMVWAVTF